MRGELPSLFLACALTVGIETPFLALWGWRGRGEMAVIFCANVVTNLTLNLLLLRFPALRGLCGYALLEAAVVGAEYLAYALAFGASRKLFLCTLLANCLSLFIGYLFQILF